MIDKPDTKRPPPTFLSRWLKRIGVSVVVLLVAGTAFLGVAEHQTSQPEFCGSCHIMEPYHESWQADLHGGKLEIACVECHYAPGERTTVKAKLRGLSQLASYVSGRYGATRPRAHVSNDSCTTSKCHGDGKFMDKVIDVGTVKFTHARHLNLDPKEQDAFRKDLDELSKNLRSVVGDERFSQLETAAQESGPAATARQTSGAGQRVENGDRPGQAGKVFAASSSSSAGATTRRHPMHELPLLRFTESRTLGKKARPPFCSEYDVLFHLPFQQRRI